MSFSHLFLLAVIALGYAQVPPDYKMCRVRLDLRYIQLFNGENYRDPEYPNCYMNLYKGPVINGKSVQIYLTNATHKAVTDILEYPFVFDRDFYLDNLDLGIAVERVGNQLKIYAGQQGLKGATGHCFEPVVAKTCTTAFNYPPPAGY